MSPRTRSFRDGKRAAGRRLAP
uniref:Uncharacterized protein n=1 Tax=Arundo donax TaxID=35708 RepID=A0A0A8YFD2_ARUDO